MSSDNVNVTILIAEDDDGHAELIVDQLRCAGLSNEIVRFRNGRELWDYLADLLAKPSAYNCRGFLLLLDIVMPVMDGLEVLRRIKAEARLSNLPVIMLTTTDDPREVESCYTLGCNWYITKPLEYARFIKVLQQLGLFLMVVTPPEVPSRGIQTRS